jgi:hypothetical protein
MGVITTAAERLHGSSTTAEKEGLRLRVVSARVQIYAVSDER